MGRASLLLASLCAIAACGDDEFTGLPDGPQGPDTPEPDGPQSGLVKLTVTDNGLPRMGVKVYFQNADSSLVVATMTDVTGVASAVMEAGGFVTAIQPFPNRGKGVLPGPLPGPTEIKTFAGVKPLDELVLSRGTPETVGISVNLLVNPDPMTSVGSYTLFAPCLLGGLDITNGAGSGSGSGSIGGPVSFFGCGETTDLTIVVSDTGGFVRSIHKDNVALVEGQPVDLTDLVYGDLDQATFEYTNVPAGIASFSVTDILVSPHGPQFLLGAEAGVDNGTGITGAAPRPANDGDLQVTNGVFFGVANTVHQTIEWGPSQAAYSKSLSNVLLADYATLPEYDIATKTASWTVGTGAAPDFALVFTDFTRPGKPTIDWNWEIVAPIGTDPSVRYPVLPAPDDDLNPITNDDAFVGSLRAAKVPGGYDTVRETVLSLSDIALGVVSGATGTVVLADLDNLIPAFRAKRTAREVLNPFANRFEHRAPRKAHRR